jgi:hypothetical protein
MSLLNYKVANAKAVCGTIKKGSNSVALWVQNGWFRVIFALPEQVRLIAKG